MCAIVIPWNYPLMMLAWKSAACLAAGNTLVLKPAQVGNTHTHAHMYRVRHAHMYRHAQLINLLAPSRVNGMEIE